MKTLFLILFFSTIAFTQTKQDSVKLAEIKSKYIIIEKVYLSTDSLQYKRRAVMEYLQDEYLALLRKSKKPKAKK